MRSLQGWAWWNTYNPSFWGGEDRTVVQGQHGQKVSENPSQPIAECGDVHLPFSYLGRKGRKIKV
jgi:hypothetical protein